jgi:hypothetical protein
MELFIQEKQKTCLNKSQEKTEWAEQNNYVFH